MFCYIYADYFGRYVPGAMQAMLKVKMGPLGTTTQGVLIATSVMMAVPMWTGWAFYIFWGVVEVALTGLVVWYAWTWPKQATVS
jgi:hypothetical protein